MNLELTTWERLILVQVVGMARGDIQTVRLGLGLMGKLDLSDEEKAEIGFREIAPGEARWDQVDRLWPLEFDDTSTIRSITSELASKLTGGCSGEQTGNLIDAGSVAAISILLTFAQHCAILPPGRAESPVLRYNGSWFTPFFPTQDLVALQ
jgi:hypothetical protein